VSGQLHAPAALPPGKEPPVPIGYEVGWTSEPVWTMLNGTYIKSRDLRQNCRQLFPLIRSAARRIAWRMGICSGKKYRLCDVTDRLSALVCWSSSDERGRQGTQLCCMTIPVPISVAPVWINHSSCRSIRTRHCVTAVVGRHRRRSGKNNILNCILKLYYACSWWDLPVITRTAGLHGARYISDDLWVARL
jgi:hypothetical protein